MFTDAVLLLSMDIVARNVYYFFHVVLSKAHREPFWTKSSVEKAITWAKYCEKVYYEATSKGYVRNITLTLEDMNTLTGGHKVITLDDLKISSQLLVAELLQCPALRKSTLQIILSSDLVQEPWLQVMCEVLVLNSVLSDLASEEDDRQRQHDRAVEVHLEKLWQLSRNAQEAEFDTLAHTSPDLLLEIAGCDQDKYSVVSNNAGLWLAKRLGSGLASPVWAQESGLLCKAACRHSALLRCLLQRLQLHPHHMEPCFALGSDAWVPARNSLDGMWDWKRITEIWTALSQGQTASPVLAAFLEKMQNGPHSDFWDDLVYYCQSRGAKSTALCSYAESSTSLLQDCWRC